MATLTDTELAGLRATLLADRAAVLASVTSLDRDDASWVETQVSGENRVRGEGEGDSVAVERHLVAQLSAQSKGALLEIDAALARMDSGSYGICDGCRQPIPVERLQVRPRAMSCVRCASRR